MCPVANERIVKGVVEAKLVFAGDLWQVLHVPVLTEAWLIREAVQVRAKVLKLPASWQATQEAPELIGMCGDAKPTTVTAVVPPTMLWLPAAK
jgi:hypothetical protein